MSNSFNNFKKRIPKKPADVRYNNLVDTYNKTLTNIKKLTMIIKEYSKSERRQYVNYRNEAKKLLKFEKQRAKGIRSNLERMSVK